VLELQSVVSVRLKQPVSNT